GKRMLQVGNVGDSTSFLARGGKALLVSEDHCVTNPVEVDRLKVRNANGSPFAYTEILTLRLRRGILVFRWSPTRRACLEARWPSHVRWEASLPSRTTFGQVSSPPRTSTRRSVHHSRLLVHGTLWKQYFLRIISTMQTELLEDDTYLIVASDGLWDIYSGQEC